MKKVILPILAMFMFTTSYAQDAKKQVKQARSAYNNYVLDQMKVDRLEEASSFIVKGLESSDEQVYKNYVLAGKIFLGLVGEDNKRLIINTKSQKKYPQAAGSAYMYFNKSNSIAEKKFEINESLDNLRSVAGDLNQQGFDAYYAKDYSGALKQFETVMEIDKLMRDSKRTPVFPADSSYQQQVYFMSVMASSSGDIDKAKLYSEQLLELGFDDPSIYSNMYTIYMDEDLTKAESYLEKGREMYPDNAKLLFTEINHYLKQNRLEELISKLELAIEKEPNNVSVRSTLGNVHEQLYNKYTETGEMEKAGKCFTNSEKSYLDALKLDENNSETNYSLGALYYNKGVLFIKEMNILAEDYSKEGTKKYEAKRAEAMHEFDNALPFFEKSYSINAKDANTLIALKEIYARQDKLELSTKYKNELDALDSGN